MSEMPPHPPPHNKNSIPTQLENLNMRLDLLTAGTERFISSINERSQAGESLCKEIQNKMDQLDRNIPSLTNYQFSPLKKPPRWKAEIRLDGNLFTESSRPDYLIKLVASTEPMPNLVVFDKHRTDGKSCAQDYSDPGFLRRHWIKKEIELQEQLMSRKKKRRKNRKRVKVNKEVAKAEGVTRKVFLADGTVAFVDDTNEVILEDNEKKGKVSAVKKTEIKIDEDQVEKEVTAGEEYEMPPLPPGGEKDESPQPPKIPEIKEELPEIPEIFSEEDEKETLIIPPPPKIAEKVEEQHEKIPSPKIVKSDENFAENVTIAPPAPPLKEEPAELKPPEEIGETEDKIEEPAAPPPAPNIVLPNLSPPPKPKPQSADNKSKTPVQAGGRINLLDSIRKGKQLKKVETPAETVEKKEEDLGSSIFMVLQRRAAIVGSDSEEETESDDDWDD